MKIVKITALLQLFIGVGAIPAGIGFIVDPSGKNLWMTTNLLINSPFETFLVPGIVLFSVIGVGSITGAFLSIKQSKNFHLFTIGLGCALIIWIVLQVYWIGFVSWLQPLYLGLGLVEALLGLALWRKKQEIITDAKM
ncbi:hypothetical protein [Alkalihalobacterium chitinilyticum]|uniref:DUF4345 domain-containing protein n=1 Tax=Alkalihalobacterium chitinilyticum TaxID=2980103 RepID=A0ABT5VJF1_9BACI|nr:hypothetical protein [Alkalihalobacterium chitinilyticum]MDE5415579.1 hypothetical protein [Alkalihalobacterium chitinilyticum]